MVYKKNRKILLLFVLHKSWYSVVSLGRCSLFSSRVGLRTYQYTLYVLRMVLSTIRRVGRATQSV